MERVSHFGISLDDSPSRRIMKMSLRNAWGTCSAEKSRSVDAHRTGVIVGTMKTSVALTMPCALLCWLLASTATKSTDTEFSVPVVRSANNSSSKLSVGQLSSRTSRTETSGLVAFQQMPQPSKLTGSSSSLHKNFIIKRNLNLTINKSQSNFKSPPPNLSSTTSFRNPPLNSLTQREKQSKFMVKFSAMK